MPTTRTPAPPTHDERVYTLLVLFSVALRPLSDGTDHDSLQIDRTALWHLAEAAGARVGRNTFHRITRELAAELATATDDEDDEDDEDDVLVSVQRRGGNRWTVGLCPVDANPWGWIEALQSLGVAPGVEARTAVLEAATEAAAALGIDTTSDLPADVLHAAPAEEQDDWNDEDQNDAGAAELTAQVCTKCHEEKPADAFSERSRPSARLSSWCRSCSRAAVREWRERHRPAGAPRLAAPADRRTSATARTTGEKVCTGCRRRRPLAYFHRDASRHDGHAVRCKVCRSDAAYQVSLYRFTDF